MFNEYLFDYLREQLMGEMAEAGPAPQVHPTTANTYLAMAGLQKGIRRGDVDVALRCAAGLITDRPRSFWRRLGIIAFEDIGIGDIDLVGRVVAAIGNKRWRTAHGGEWRVAAHLIERMCEAVKDRTADDMVVVIENAPDLDRLRLDLADLSLASRLDFIAAPDQRLDRRGLAAWYTVGTKRFEGVGLAEVMGDPTAYFDSLIEYGVAETVVEVSRAGLSKTNTILPVFLPLIWQASQQVAMHTEPDPMPEMVMVGDLPSYAYDIFTRDGHRALKAYLGRSKAMTAFLRTHAPSGSPWHKIVGQLLFRVESGLLSRRLSWDISGHLRHQAGILDQGISPEAVSEGQEIMRNEIPLLNQARIEIASTQTGGGVYG